MRLFLGVSLLFGLLVVVAAPARTARTFADDRCAVSGDDQTLDREEQAAVDTINGLRAQRGLAPLAVSVSLTRAARWKSDAMAGGASFAHDDFSRSWVQRVKDCGFSYSSWLSENIAAGYGDANSTVTQWVNSPLHRDNMLDPSMRAIGIARRPGGYYGWYWTADFADTAADVMVTSGG